MEFFIETIEHILHNVVTISTSGLELFGIIILMTTAIKCFAIWVQKKEGNIRLELAQGIALALEFKMGGEVLKTVIVQSWSELGILGAIIVLRAALTFLIHWEIKNEGHE